ncbi:hypothetical protein ACP70R_031417 [Stipagrostis hirtigluma subsp. patula]
MPPLELEESKILFFKKVFQQEECPPEYEHLPSVSILKKCNGLPLAIVSIGGMLARTENKTKAEWEKVCKRLGSGLGTNATIAGMRRILSLSYHDLPYHLKACFLYLSMYPEDYEIKRGPLVRQWVAEGFISGTQESPPEEVAEKYLDEFVDRSIVIPTSIASTGVVRCCKVHDIMLDVITSKSIQENFISFMSNQHNSATGHDKIRRLLIHSNTNGRDKEEDPNINFSHARTLSIRRSSKRPRAISSFADLKLLRVLDLEGCQWLNTADLKEICKLCLLRYLCLRRTNVPELPKLIGRLKELMTLDVRETSITGLPETINQLERLKHLLGGKYAHYTRISRVKGFEPYKALILPRGLKKMKSLQKIAHVDIGKSYGALEELSELSQVTKLCVINHESGGEKWRHFAKSLSKLCDSIRCLSIIHWLKDDMGLEVLWRLESPPVFLEKLYLWGKLSALPPWIPSLSYLVELSLRENFLDVELVGKLGKLPSLASLKLYSGSYVGTKLCFEKDQFLSLKELIVDNLPHLDELSFEGGAPALERLTLAFFRNPASGISGFQNLPKLKEIEFFGGVIVKSLVEKVKADAKSHSEGLRVYLHDRPIDDSQEPGGISGNMHFSVTRNKQVLRCHSQGG